ncbi:NAD(P)/FAD-dependent oxidoreductase [Rhodococcus aetherivorans]
MSVSTLVIVGASLAGVRAAEGARRGGFGGDIVLVGEEDCLPYDRPPLTKQGLAADSEVETRPLRAESVLRDDLRVRLRLGVRATGLDLAARVVSTTSGDLDFDALVIATGCRARPAPAHLESAAVHTIRTVFDARHLRNDLDRASSVAIIGAGFVGSEVASAARLRGLEVTVVEESSAPLVRAVGEEASIGFAKLHTTHGVRLKTGTTVDALVAGKASSELFLSDGDHVVADVVVVAIGTEPNTEWLGGSGLDLTDGVECQPDLGVGVPGIAAAGDICRWTDPRWGRATRHEHWTNAAEQGPHAARTALHPDHHVPFSSTPYFWSELYGRRIQLLGRTDGDECVTLGDVDGGDYMALYRNGDRLQGVLTVGPTSHTAPFRGILAEGGTWNEAVTTASATRL